ncbi:MAG: phytanoyl-CoA dioxygenase family protein, partial [Campylobacterales bacterium]|nr:phytanoyl-CoA dioxygenase family protein [Campylobacterales bacterium]
MELTQKQLDFFNENGFILLKKFASKKECKSILEIAKIHLKYRIEPLETELGYDKKSKDFRTNESDYKSLDFEEKAPVRRLRQVYDRDVIFKNWMENKEIRPILKQILKDEVVITLAHHNSIMTKLPKISTQTRWHQDRRYWRYNNDNLVSIWLALDKEYLNNGVLEFIPGSHKIDFTKEQFDEKEYFKEDLKENKKLIKTKISKKLERGDVVIFHSMLLHRANKNNTKKPKISFVYTVKGAQTKATEGTRSNAYKEVVLHDDLT